MIRAIYHLFIRPAVERAACIPAALAIGGLDRRTRDAHAEADRAIARARSARDVHTSDELEMLRGELQVTRRALVDAQRGTLTADEADAVGALLRTVVARADFGRPWAFNETLGTGMAKLASRPGAARLGDGAPRPAAAPTCSEAAELGAHHRCGACRYNADHGAEAEELRKGIEKIVAGRNDSTAARLQLLLDRVNARDSLAHLTAQDEARLTEPEPRDLERILHASDPASPQASGLRKLLVGAGKAAS